MSLDKLKKDDAASAVPETLNLCDDAIVNVTVGFPKKKHSWEAFELTQRGLFETLSIHRVGNKEGAAFVPGNLSGNERKKNAVTQLDALVFDIDNGTPLSEIKRKLAQANLLACIYSSHSHGKTETLIPEDQVLKHVEREGGNE